MSEDWVIDVDDLARLWDECRRCAYLAVARRFPRPATGHDDDAASRLAGALAGQSLEQVARGAPEGRLAAAERLLSLPYEVPLPDRVQRCAVRVVPDVFAHGAAGATLAALVVDAPGRVDGMAAARRLHAAAWALERPADGKPQPVAALGLLVWRPGNVVIGDDGAAALAGDLAWKRVDRDDGMFLGFLAEAAALLSEPAPPPGTALCPWCVYRDASRRTGL